MLTCQSAHWVYRLHPASWLFSLGMSPAQNLSAQTSKYFHSVSAESPSLLHKESANVFISVQLEDNKQVISRFLHIHHVSNCSFNKYFNEILFTLRYFHLGIASPVKCSWSLFRNWMNNSTCFWWYNISRMSPCTWDICIQRNTHNILLGYIHTVT